MDLNTLIENLNGTAMSSSGTGEWGYIPDNWKMAIPAVDRMDYPVNFQFGNSPFANNGMKIRFIKANYARISPIVNSPEIALFLSILRAEIANLGLIARSITHRSVTDDEYVYVDPRNGDWNDAVNNVPVIPNSNDIARFVKVNLRNFVHQLVFVFLSRGHHWAPDYDGLFNKLKTACLMGATMGFAMPTNEMIYRYAMHPFGIFPLYHMMEQNRANGDMSYGMVLRLGGGSVIAGTAYITTSHSVVRAMANETWGDSFTRKFGDEIAALQLADLDIKGHERNYHVAHKHLGADTLTKVSVEAADAFERLSPLIVGYIKYLGRNSTFAGAISLLKQAGPSTFVADAFVAVLEAYNRVLSGVATIDEFFDRF